MKHIFDILVVTQDGDRKYYACEGDVKRLRALCVRLYDIHHPRYVECFDRITKKTLRYSF